MSQVAGGASYRARQPEIHAAQDGENEITIMLEMGCRRNIVTYTRRVPYVRKSEK